MRFATFLIAASLWAEETTKSPLYHVTVVARSTKAVNYGHRALPTRIDFKGTVLYPEARGQASVESRRGAVEIDAKFNGLDAPTRFGASYLTYVLWALTPEGRPRNLGEVVLNGSNKGRLKVSSELQSFAMIVTAEPYFSVTQPSGVVVMENVIRPDTVGTVETVEARYDLLPREHYTYEIGAEGAPAASGPKVSMDEYESILAIYQAQHALQIAREAGAERAAAGTLRRAEELYQRARHLKEQKGQARQVIMTARQATQTAEDARIIAAKRP
ncbi:MAG: anti-sigma factor [Bryobacteraceae bacterium]|nr:anti-sigma factor [Bryobacteraceae bacterium]